jgi:hypothetical protein
VQVSGGVGPATKPKKQQQRGQGLEVEQPAELLGAEGRKRGWR